MVVAADGTIVRRADRAHGVSTPHPGWYEQDADSLWWSDFVAVVRRLVDSEIPIDAVGVSGIGPCLLPADRHGKPLRPGILYGIDTRCAAEVDDLSEEIGAEAIITRGGTALNTQALGPRLRWLARYEPEVFEKTRMLFMASSYLVYRLTGRYVLDHHSGSKSNPLYDLGKQDWAWDWSEAVAPDLTLPELHWPGEIVGHVSPEAAAETGLPAGLPVTCGTIDSWAEAISVGLSAPGDTMIMYGTTTFLTRIMAAVGPYEGLWAAMGSAPRQFLASAGIATSGAVTDWLRQLVDAPYEVLTSEAGAAPAGSRGLLALPYFAGEWTPNFNPDARGTIAGLTTAHTRGDLYRAALEGVGFGVRRNLEAMSNAGGDSVSRLIAVGGGTAGRVWSQIISDIVGLPQQIPTETIGASLGNARMAAAAQGVDTSGWNRIRAVIEPDTEVANLYTQYYQQHLALYDATTDISRFLAEQQRSAGTTLEP